MTQYRHRRRLRRKEIESIASSISGAIGCDVFSVEDTVDMAESGDHDIIMVNGSVLAFVIDKVPFLTVRGFLKYEATRRFVTVDMGAVPFVCNGADVMAPGIVEADTGIQEGDLVWIRDVKNVKPLAVGLALVSGQGMTQNKAGKAVKNLHYVGDKLWKLEE